MYGFTNPRWGRGGRVLTFSENGMETRKLYPVSASEVPICRTTFTLRHWFVTISVKFRPIEEEEILTGL